MTRLEFYAIFKAAASTFAFSRSTGFLWLHFPASLPREPRVLLGPKQSFSLSVSICGKEGEAQHSGSSGGSPLWFTGADEHSLSSCL